MNIHAPVLLDEAIKGLDIKKSGIYIDCTFGRGGHSKQILDCLNEDGRLIAFDQDDDAQSYFDENFNDPRLKFFKKNFSELTQVVKDLDLNGKIDGVLFDLGVSSPQL
ncbi:MAG: 16S rRNA (cytosine(1402)-N(4))-methyltransferase, partial [Gammaproteobacteria bacterium]